MVDESFHLTPVDARRYDFGSALRGYDKTRVDQFRDQVADELERLSRVNQELEAKAKGFHEQLRAFRERDKALNDALISAQQLLVESLGLGLEFLVHAAQPFEFVGLLVAELVHARLVVAAQRRPEVVAPRVHR